MIGEVWQRESPRERCKVVKAIMIEGNKSFNGCFIQPSQRKDQFLDYKIFIPAETPEQFFERMELFGYKKKSEKC